LKGIHKSSATPSKDQNCESWLLKKKRSKPKVYIIYSTKKGRKFPKSQERDPHSGTGSLLDTKKA
jgi:hypothetical protein